MSSPNKQFIYPLSSPRNSDFYSESLMYSFKSLDELVTMQIPGSHFHRFRSVGLRKSPGICIVISHPHPWVILTQGLVVNTLINNTLRPLGHLWEATVTKGTLVTPVSTMKLQVQCTHFLQLRSVHQPIPEGTDTMDLTEMSPGVAATVMSCHIAALFHPRTPSRSLADLLLQF